MNQYPFFTAQAIQEASELRLWVALAGNFFLSVADPQQVKEAVEYGIQQLEKAGMTSKNYVGVGHGMSGMSCIQPLIGRKLFH